MSILLKQRHFSDFTRPELKLRVLPQQSHVTLVWRGVLSLSWVTFFGKPMWVDLKACGVVQSFWISRKSPE